MVRRMEKWTAPKKGWYKVNSDGGFRKESGNVGIRVVVRNVKGVLVDGYSGRVKADNELVVEGGGNGSKKRNKIGFRKEVSKNNSGNGFKDSI